MPDFFQARNYFFGKMRIENTKSESGDDENAYLLISVMKSSTDSCRAEPPSTFFIPTN